MLYGIKQCHRCIRRNICNLKGDPKTILKTSKQFRVTNRGIDKNADVPDVIIYSLCKYFEPEQRDVEMLKKPDKLVEFNKNVEKVCNLGKKMEKMARLDTPFNTIPADEEARKRICGEQVG